jgi:hypothetical protein
MRSLMARLDLWLGFELMIIIAQQQFSPSSLIASQFMGHPAGSEEITVQRMLEWPNGWKRTEVEREVRISG